MGACAIMAAFRDMEELCQGLLSLLGANHAEAQQRRLLGRYRQMMERLLETQDSAEQQLRGHHQTHDSHRKSAGTTSNRQIEKKQHKQTIEKYKEILEAEKDVAQSLLDAKEQACQGVAELQQIEAKLQKASEEDTHLKASLLQLARELEDLKEIEADLEKQENETDEDTRVTIPAAVYVAQLYHRISKIEWDYECEPGMIKGIHCGPSVAQPIHLDSTQLSKKFISDYLWGLVDMAW